MSKMLEQAIVDAEALKEAAIKNAEATIIERYSDDIKNVVDQLLEQEGPPMDPAMMDPAMMDPAMMDPAMMGGAPQGPPMGPENYNNIPGAHEMVGEGSTVVVDLGQLKDQLKAESDGVDPKDVEMGALVAEEIAGTGEMVEPKESEETFVIEESVIMNILSEVMDTTPSMTVGQTDEKPAMTIGDMPTSPTTPEIPEIAPEPTPVETETGMEEDLDLFENGDFDFELDEEEDYHLDEEEDLEETHDVDDVEKMHERNNILQQNLYHYHEQYAKLYEAYENETNKMNKYTHGAKALHEQNEKLKNLLVRTQDKLNEINVQNAKLHYTNRTLSNVSLNERQKDKIVEAVQRAGTVEEAKTIFETLQSAVAGIDGLRKSPKSLNEAINRNSSALFTRSREETHPDSGLRNRMQRLAGIK